MSDSQHISNIISEKQVHPLPRKLIEVTDAKVGDGLFYFHEQGDFLKGILVGQHIRECLHYDMKTYVMKVWEARQDGVNCDVKDKKVVEFPANMKMRRIIEDNELMGSLIRIVYRGKRGRYKLYDVFKDIGTFYEREEQKHGRSRRKKSKRKRSKRIAG